jgi:hypothetical protein
MSFARVLLPFDAGAFLTMLIPPSFLVCTLIVFRLGLPYQARGCHHSNDRPHAGERFRH